MPDSPAADIARRKIPFTIDGKLYETDDLEQPAANLLRLAGLDPAMYDLGEVTKDGPSKHPFKDDEIVKIHKDARYVSIRQEAPFA